MPPFPGEWTDRAPCKGKTDIFFPTADDRSAKAAALAICKTCRVKPHCREWVLNHRERGIWAGMGHKDAAAERKRLGIRLTSIDAFL